MTDAERKADLKLAKLRDVISSKDYSCTINRFKELHHIILESDIYRALNIMPKGAIHHIHSTASIPIEAFIEITKEDFVYYNDRDKLLKCYPKQTNIDPYYVKCNDLRNFMGADEFDNYLRRLIPLTDNCPDDKSIWDHFEDKFTLVYDLIKYKPFFRKCIKIGLEKCIAQNVFIIEMRHITGNLFNDDKERITLAEELEMWKEIYLELKEETPHFQLKMIVTGHKFFGQWHIEKMFDHIQQSTENED